MASAKSAVRRRILGAVMAAVSMLAMATGCGEPEFQYVANSDEQTYFRVPSAWHEIDPKLIEAWASGENPESATADLRRQSTWSTAYDAAENPMPEHMTTLMSTTAPVLWARVRHLTENEQGQVSFDALRDSVLPVSETTRRAWAEQTGSTEIDSFELLLDEVLTPQDGVRGVRVVFNYEFSTGVVHTFDQTAYASNDSSTVYLLLIRCTATCYRDRTAEIDGIATSFTVRSRT